MVITVTHLLVGELVVHKCDLKGLRGFSTRLCVALQRLNRLPPAMIIG